MILIAVLLGSLVMAAGIGYLGVAADQGIKIVAESKVGAKVGQWLFLLPLLDFGDHLASEVIPDLIRRFVDVVHSALEVIADLIRRFVGAVGFLFVLVLVLGAICALLAALWFLVGALISVCLLLFHFLWRHLEWVTFGLIVIIVAVYFAKRMLR